jgi:hypothetical protein
MINCQKDNMFVHPKGKRLMIVFIASKPMLAKARAHGELQGGPNNNIVQSACHDTQTDSRNDPITVKPVPTFMLWED